MSISVIIPAYKAPEALEVCLESAIKGQDHANQIIVVVDGFYELNAKVLEKYSNDIEVLDLETNQGLQKATNLGVYNAKFDKILIVNDDNVFPQHWDTALLASYDENAVIAPNQIEPFPSMFKQFNIKNLGRDPEIFNLEEFWKYEKSLSRDFREEAGSTLPIFMSKKNYMQVGGWDESYPGAWVVDWDFFLKCELSGMKMIRTYSCHFYHFVSVGTESTPTEKQVKQQREYSCHVYFQYKWGQPAQHNPVNNSKMLRI